MKKIVSGVFLIMYAFMAEAQEWVTYRSSNTALPDDHIEAIAIDENNVKWIGTVNGLVQVSGSKWKTYNPGNSLLPSSLITAIATNGNGGIWIGTDKGLAFFNGLSWQVYTTQNTTLPNNGVTQLFFDKHSAILWIGTGIGLTTYDGTQWINQENSNPYFGEEMICSVTADKNGNVWVGSFDHFQFQGRLWKFNEGQWKRMKLEDYGLNSSFPNTLAVSEENEIWMGVKGTMGGFLVRVETDNLSVVAKSSFPCLHGGVTTLLPDKSTLWLGTGNGLIFYEDINCSLFTALNSPLKDSYIKSVSVDKLGNKWIGTQYGGIAVFRKGGVLHDTIARLKKDEFLIFPNPVSASSTISFFLQESTQVHIQIFDVQGRLVKTLANQFYGAGNHILPFRTAGVQPGLYYCRILSGKLRQSIPVWINAG